MDEELKFMIKIVYNLTLQFTGKDTIVVESLEKLVEASALGEANVIAQEYLDKLEATLEKIETGKNGLIRVGSEIFSVTVDNIPRISVHVIATGTI